MQPTTFEQFKTTQEVRYELVATLNDQVLYKSEFSTVEDLMADGVCKAERAVEHQMKLNFDWNTEQAKEVDCD